MRFEIEGAGTAVAMRSKRARRMRITVTTDCIRVAVPLGVPMEKAEAFVKAHTQWIRYHVRRMERREKAGRELLQNVPPIDDMGEARQKIASRLRYLSGKTGLSYSRLTIRNQKTRWGSMNTKNSISLNINLARLPEVLMDYVILHELVHTKVRGHGPKFWHELDKYVGDAKRLRSELRKYMLQLM